MSRPSPCDICGQPVLELVDAVAVLRFDRDDALAAATFAHRTCAPTRAAQGERLEVLDRDLLIRPRRTLEKLDGLARYHAGASISRLRQKIARLAPRLKADAS